MSLAPAELSVLSGTSNAQVALLNFTREEIDTIKRTVAKGVTDAELSMFLTICSRYQLDPFLKEIWCYKRQKKDNNGKYVDDPNAPAIIMTSRDGYLKAAQRDENFDGMKSFVVKEGDTFEIDADGDKVIHKFGAKRGTILGAWAAVYHKHRRPVIVYVDHAEYKAGTTTWNNYPSAMIQKVAEAFALKRQFSINGLVTQEEMESSSPDMSGAITPEYTMGDAQPDTRPTPSHHREPVGGTPQERVKAMEELLNYAEPIGILGDELRAIGAQLTGKPDPKKWTMADILSVRAEVERRASAQFAQEEVSQGEQAGLPLDDLPSDDDLPF